MKKLNVCCSSCVYAELNKDKTATCTNKNREGDVTENIASPKDYCCSSYELNQNALYKYLNKLGANYVRCKECKHFYSNMCCLDSLIVGNDDTCPKGEKGDYMYKTCCACTYYDSSFGKCKKHSISVGAFIGCHDFNRDEDNCKNHGIE